MRRISFLSALVLAGVLFTAAAQAGTDEGRKAIEAGNYDQAMKILEPLADEGNAGANFYLGEMYRNGYGVKQSSYRAAKFYQKAARGNYPMPQRRLAYMFHAGEGVGKDLKKAYMWAAIGKALGDPMADGRLQSLSAEMSAEDVAAAGQMYRDWRKDKASPNFRWVEK